MAGKGKASAKQSQSPSSQDAVDSSADPIGDVSKKMLSLQDESRKLRQLRPLVLSAVLESTNNKIWIETGDGQTEEITGEIASLSPFVQRELIKHAKGSKKEEPIVLPKPVDREVLDLILEYAKFHSAPGRSDKERKLFDEKFIRLNTRTLCELTSAADSLDIKPLVDLTSKALARMIEGKTPEEIRETFNLPDDLTEEEKLEPVRTATDDPRIRLLNRFYAKKRKELAERKALKEKSPDEPVVKEDTRSVEELLSFIENGSSKDSDKLKHKPKRKKKKTPTKTGRSSSESQDCIASPYTASASAASASSRLPGPSNDLYSIEAFRTALQGASQSASAHSRELSENGSFDSEDDAVLDDFSRHNFGNHMQADWNHGQQDMISYQLDTLSFPLRRSRITKLTSLSEFKARKDAANGMGHSASSAAASSSTLTTLREANISSSEDDKHSESCSETTSEDEDEAVSDRDTGSALGSNQSMLNDVTFGTTDIVVISEAITSFLQELGLGEHIKVLRQSSEKRPAIQAAVPPRCEQFSVRRRLPNGTTVSILVDQHNHS